MTFWKKKYVVSGVYIDKDLIILEGINTEEQLEETIDSFDYKDINNGDVVIIKNHKFVKLDK